MHATKIAIPSASLRAGSCGQQGNEAFPELVMNDLMPMIDTCYRTFPDRMHRAIAGLSMGGGQALQIGLGHLDKFAYIASFSGVLQDLDLKTSYGRVFTDPASFNKSVCLLWLGAGLGEPRIHDLARKFHQALTQSGINNVFFKCPFAHEWQTWRYDLQDLAPRLFH